MRQPNVLDKLPQDKLLHFSIGVVSFLLTQIAVALIWPQYSTRIALTATIIIGAGIEIYQRITKTGKAEFLDFWAVAVGGLMMAASAEINGVN